MLNPCIRAARTIFGLAETSTKPALFRTARFVLTFTAKRLRLGMRSWCTTPSTMAQQAMALATDGTAQFMVTYSTPMMESVAWLCSLMEKAELC